jgi:phenylpropionate dioxygenase-like ring-hydroxylating dioxygenase large terminal subunit
MALSLKDFWYIVAESKDLRDGKVLGVELLDEWIALYRDGQGKATAVVDRCLHRNARLSKGRVIEGELVCPYHGWKYGAKGQLMAIPSEGERFQPKASRCIPRYSCEEKEGYIYVRLSNTPEASIASLQPFSIPYLNLSGYKHIRLKHLFEANVPNCAENFIDIPHTTYVHPGVFRYEKKPQKIEAEVEQENANVHIRYRKETSNFGWFSKFLNRADKEIFHEDHYYFPNITHVEYRFGPRMHFNITSQSIPISEQKTLVYTDLTWDYGIWNFLSTPFVRWAAKKIIAQDVKIMGEQTEVVKKYGELFANTKCDLHHVWIEKIYADLRAGRDPRENQAKKEVVDFYI